ncbi:hypothetical protein P691DRAFT_803343 [Macrolepiota fuliginosa MF-IS2]|uniref:N-acetyltransferase domain-containing protein n=1 Tax=Macrolepiota fuliginosa MF-IS2 TaxID=1400762 RepID=A0A9P5X9B7_9AGAR|nr:hypothetical protein P691DRAFT_803343 [Macrolepiota fuliginosa MF-IS2]
MTAPNVSVWVAAEEDFDRITDIVAEAFIHDPVFNYFASLRELIPKDQDTREKKNLHKWARFMLRLCVAARGRVTVIVEKQDSAPDRIVGMAQWLPPNKRLALWHVRTMFKAGIVGMIKRWGVEGLLRCGFEWLDGTHNAMVKVFREREMKSKDPDATWYLQLIAVAPECQGKGYMSKLIQEGYNNAPDEIFTLEATTAASRDKYAHLGFEAVSTLTLGNGKSDAQGLSSKGKSATGVEAYLMVKIPH